MFLWYQQELRSFQEGDFEKESSQNGIAAAAAKYEEQTTESAVSSENMDAERPQI